ncbi:hypothetical protein Tdes44962_MAKER06098 [Teratosphaeria destructans]|uniref:Uncharacterized protein n=1 Tax=Teratosphaeria destructans TaxID=418781 RepID=A0A9W7VXT8_9PEZI|nr:hypothetical protein Tdes44962_MAKER06098 [Teratosphaeria destructans]
MRQETDQAEQGPAHLRQLLISAADLSLAPDWLEDLGRFCYKTGASVLDELEQLPEVTRELIDIHIVKHILLADYSRYKNTIPKLRKLFESGWIRPSTYIAVFGQDLLTNQRIVPAICELAEAQSEFEEAYQELYKASAARRAGSRSLKRWTKEDVVSAISAFPGLDTPSQRGDKEKEKRKKVKRKRKTDVFVHGRESLAELDAEAAPRHRTSSAQIDHDDSNHLESPDAAETRLENQNSLAAEQNLDDSFAPNDDNIAGEFEPIHTPRRPTLSDIPERSEKTSPFSQLEVSPTLSAEEENVNDLCGLNHSNIAGEELTRTPLRRILSDILDRSESISSPASSVHIGRYQLEVLPDTTPEQRLQIHWSSSPPSVMKRNFARSRSEEPSSSLSAESSKRNRTGRRDFLAMSDRLQGQSAQLPPRQIKQPLTMSKGKEPATPAAVPQADEVILGLSKAELRAIADNTEQSGLFDGDFMLIVLTMMRSNGWAIAPSEPHALGDNEQHLLLPLEIKDGMAIAYLDLQQTSFEIYCPVESQQAEALAYARNYLSATSSAAWTSRIISRKADACDSSFLCTLDALSRIHSIQLMDGMVCKETEKCYAQIFSAALRALGSNVVTPYQHPFENEPESKTHQLNTFDQVAEAERLYTKLTNNGRLKSWTRTVQSVETLLQHHSPAPAIAVDMLKVERLRESVRSLKHVVTLNGSPGNDTNGKLLPVLEQQQHELAKAESGIRPVEWVVGMQKGLAKARKEIRLQNAEADAVKTSLQMFYAGRMHQLAAGKCMQQEAFDDK